MITTEVFTNVYEYPFLECGNVAIITDSIVKDLYGLKFQEHLLQMGKKVSLFAFPSGEEYKTRATKELLEDQLLKENYGRDTTILALGGGVVTDLAGFVAATYCRGIPYISIPTTLLGLIDAAIGGKVGVNTPQGKNLIGSFYPPQKIIVDTSLLETLPAKELLSGKAEMIKYGFIEDPELLKGAITLNSIQKCIEIKKAIVTKDPLEQGLRRILNFGHTFGHAIETALNYRITHGEAVAIGMFLEADLSYRMGFLPKKDLFQIVSHLKDEGFCLNRNLCRDKVKKALMSDKKNENHAVRCVLLEGIGRVASFSGKYCCPLPMIFIDEVLLNYEESYHFSESVEGVSHSSSL